MRFIHQVVGAIAVSAACAGLFVQLEFAPADTAGQASVAGIETMQMLRDEHALVADFVTQNVEAQREANLAADQDAVRMKLAAAEPEESPATSFAETKRMPAVAPVRKVVARAPEPVQPPLRLAELMQPVAPKPAVPASSGNVVTTQVRNVVATVERIPALVLGAANWVVELPSQALPRLAQRRHFVSL